MSRAARGRRRRTGVPRVSGVLRISGALALAAALLVGAWAPADLQARQDPGEDVLEMPEARDTADDPCRFRARLMAVAGMHGLGGQGSHPYVGAEGGFLVRGFGLMGTGQYGSGDDFRSLLVGGGPAARVLELDYLSLTAYGGIAWYEEEIAAGFTRDLTGVFGGLSLRVPLPVGAVGLSLSLWRGTFDEEGLDRPVGRTGRRLSIGIGF